MPPSDINRECCPGRYAQLGLSHAYSCRDLDPCSVRERKVERSAILIRVIPIVNDVRCTIEYFRYLLEPRFRCPVPTVGNGEPWRAHIRSIYGSARDNRPRRDASEPTVIGDIRRQQSVGVIEVDGIAQTITVTV